MGLHWYLAAQLQGSRAPSLTGLRAPTRLTLHLLAGVRSVQNEGKHGQLTVIDRATLRSPSPLPDRCAITAR